jgi:hypothetical protein
MMSRNSCKHLNRRNIFGDEINITKYRQRCTDCGRVVPGSSVDIKGMSGQKFMDTDALLESIDEILQEMVH